MHGNIIKRLKKDSDKLPRTVDIYEDGYTTYRKIDGSLIEGCQTKMSGRDAIDFFKDRGYFEVEGSVS